MDEMNQKKHITVVASEPLMDFDMALERDRVLKNYDVLLPDELRPQMAQMRKKMDKPEKEEFHHFMEEADRYIHDDLRRLDKEAADHGERVFHLRKMMSDMKHELEVKRNELGDNHPDVQTIGDSIASLSQQADEAQHDYDGANTRYKNRKKENEIADPELHEVQKEAMYHLMKGNLGDTTLMGMHPRLAEFGQQRMQTLGLPPNAERRIAPGFTEMTNLMKTDPAADGQGMVWPLDAGGDMQMGIGAEATQKQKHIEKMGFRPGQTQQIKKKRTVGTKKVQIDPISESWRKDRDMMRQNPNHNVKVEVLKPTPYSLDDI